MFTVSFGSVFVRVIPELSFIYLPIALIYLLEPLSTLLQ